MKSTMSMAIALNEPHIYTSDDHANQMSQHPQPTIRHTRQSESNKSHHTENSIFRMLLKNNTVCTCLTNIFLENSTYYVSTCKVLLTKNWQQPIYSSSRCRIDSMILESKANAGWLPGRATAGKLFVTGLLLYPRPLCPSPSLTFPDD